MEITYLCKMSCINSMSSIDILEDDISQVIFAQPDPVHTNFSYNPSALGLVKLK